MSKYQANFLGSNSYLQDMIDAQVADLNQDLSKRLLKNPLLKSYKSIAFSLEGSALLVKAINRSGEEFSHTISHDDLPSVKLDIDTLNAYYDEVKINNFPLSFSDYPMGLDFEFLESKEPELLNQLILLEVLQSVDLEIKIQDKLQSNC